MVRSRGFEEAELVACDAAIEVMELFEDIKAVDLDEGGILFEAFGVLLEASDAFDLGLSCVFVDLIA